MESQASTPASTLQMEDQPVLVRKEQNVASSRTYRQRLKLRMLEYEFLKKEAEDLEAELARLHERMSAIKLANAELELKLLLMTEAVNEYREMKKSQPPSP